MRRPSAYMSIFSMRLVTNESERASSAARRSLMPVSFVPSTSCPVLSIGAPGHEDPVAIRATEIAVSVDDRLRIRLAGFIGQKAGEQELRGTFHDPVLELHRGNASVSR